MATGGPRGSRRHHAGGSSYGGSVLAVAATAAGRGDAGLGGSSVSGADTGPRTADGDASRGGRD